MGRDAQSTDSGYVRTGRRWRRRLSVLSPTTLRWFIGLLSTLVGALLLVVPHRFEVAYSGLVADLGIWGFVFLVTGLGFLLVLSSRLSGRWVLVAHLPVALAFLALSFALLPAGLWTGSVSTSLLGLGALWAGFLPLRRRPGPARGDLFSFSMGILGVVNGALVLSARFLGDSPVESSERWLWLMGALWLVASLFLVRIQLQPVADERMRRVTHLAAGLLFIGAGLGVSVPQQAWFGVMFHCGAGLVLLLLPTLRRRLRHFDPLSLRIRLALVPAVAAIASLTLTVAWMTQQQERRAERQALQILSTQADTVAQNVVDFIQLKGADIHALAHEAALGIYGQGQPQPRVVVEACREYPDFFACILLNRQTQELARAGELPAGMDPTALYQQIVDAHQDMADQRVELILVATPEKTIPLLAAPVVSRGGLLLGSLVAALDPRSLDRRIGRSDSDVYLSDGYGLPIARELPLSPESGQGLQGPVAEGRGHRDLVATARVSAEDLGWIVEVRQPRSVGLAGVRKGRETAFLSLLVMVVLSAWGGIWAALTITRPLGELARAVDELEVDRLDATWHPSKGGHARELDRLSAAFDHLRERLAEQTREREQLALELQARAEMLAEQDRRKDEFLAMLAHELRNPLGAISSAVFLLREEDEDPADRERRLATIERQIHHLARMVDDLLDVSRITRGKVELRRERLDLVPLVRDVASDFSAAVEAKEHRLELDLPEKPVWAEVDATRFGQILGNLMSNAVKYTDPGGEIRVRLREKTGDAGSHDQAVLTVEDTGRGLEQELLPHVFDLFAQGDQGLDRPDSGLGIGLTLVRQLARMHGGSAEARSPGPGRGSTFIVRLPRTTPPAESPAAGSGGMAQARGERVLVVDDHADAADALAEVLRHRGHEVRVAGDGPEAVRMADTFQPDAVLVDIGLPGMDGYAVARELRRNGRDCLLIAVTGYGRAEDRRRAHEAGFDHFLTKPLEIDELSRLLVD